MSLAGYEVRCLILLATIDLFSLRKLVPQLWFRCLVVSGIIRKI